MADASLADMEKQLADHAAAVKALKAKIAERKAKAAAAPPPPPAPAPTTAIAAARELLQEASALRRTLTG